MKFTKKQIEQLIKDIYSGVYNPSDNLPEDLYFAIGEHLENAVFDGFGTDFGGDDLQLAEDLRTNTWLFSGAKTYQQVREMAELIAASPTFKDFKKAVLPVYEKYNVDWLKAEYNTAIGQSKQARQWNDFERNKELFPYLRYNAVMDANTSTICRPLDGVTLPVDDPMWNKFSPLNHFNCRCILEKIDKYEDVKLTPKSEVDKLTKELNETVQPEFKMNPGKDGYVFSDKHPYFEVAPKDKDFAKRNFDLPIPESNLSQKIKFEPAKSIKEAEEYAKNNIANYVQFNVTDKHLYGINQMNEELGSLLSEYKKFSFGERDKLNSLIVKAFNSKKELGRSGFADHTGNISMNQFALLNSEKSIELLRKQAEAGILIKVKKGDEIKAIVRHEFAHTLWQKTSINEITDTAKEFQKKINSLYKQYLNEPNAFIGSYSKTNVDEFFAEHFAAAKYGKQTKYTKIVSELTKKYFK